MNFKPIISQQIRCRVPEHFIVGEGSIIDDFSYFSTRVHIGQWCHIANGVSIAGGREHRFTMGDFCSISAGVKIWCQSNDFHRDLAVLPPGELDLQQHSLSGDVRIDECSIVGSNSVVMPHNHIPIGVTIGALSFVPYNFKFESWSVYAGTPIKKIGMRDQQSVLAQKEKLLIYLESRKQ